MIKMIGLNAYQIMADVWVVNSGVWRGYTLKEKMKKILFFRSSFFLKKIKKIMYPKWILARTINSIIAFIFSTCFYVRMRELCNSTNGIYRNQSKLFLYAFF